MVHSIQQWAKKYHIKRTNPVVFHAPSDGLAENWYEGLACIFMTFILMMSMRGVKGGSPLDNFLHFFGGFGEEGSGKILMQLYNSSSYHFNFFFSCLIQWSQDQGSNGRYWKQG
jgi:hypothetical protein